MSRAVVFFRASEGDVVANWNAGAIPAEQRSIYGNFDAEEALLVWESRIAGRGIEELLDEGIPDELWEDDRGSLIMALPEGVSGWLPMATDRQVEELADFWRGRTARSGRQMSQEIAVAILRGVAKLLADASGLGERIYCWSEGI